jgi:sugar phosphate isomerase/epimerase
MILGYNTNGLSGMTIGRAIGLLDEIGYRGIAITLDQDLLNPFSDRLKPEIEQTVAALRRHEFRCVVETGARFLLDPQTKHEPTLVSADPAGRQRRIEFLCRAIDIAADLQADCVSLWSGTVRDGAGDREAMGRLTSGLRGVIEHAAARSVVIGFEPEPGMFIDTMARYGDLLTEISSQRIGPDLFRLTIDVGHLHCQGEVPIADQLRKWAELLVNVHIEDMRRGVHEHLTFGDGEIDFPPVIAALKEIGYDGMVGVELSRHGHEGPAAARRAYEFLASMLDAGC